MPMTSATTLVRNCLVVASVGEPKPVGGPRASRVSWSISAIGDAPIIPSIHAGVYEHRSLVRIWQESEVNQITQRQRTAIITKRQGNYKEHYDFRQSSIMSLIVCLSQECWLAWEPFSRKLLASVVCMLFADDFGTDLHCCLDPTLYCPLLDLVCSFECNVIYWLTHRMTHW